MSVFTDITIFFLKIDFSFLSNVPVAFKTQKDLSLRVLCRLAMGFLTHTIIHLDKIQLTSWQLKASFMNYANYNQLASPELSQKILSSVLKISQSEVSQATHRLKIINLINDNYECRLKLFMSS